MTQKNTKYVLRLNYLSQIISDIEDQNCDINQEYRFRMLEYDKIHFRVYINGKYESDYTLGMDKLGSAKKQVDLLFKRIGPTRSSDYIHKALEKIRKEKESQALSDIDDILSMEMEKLTSPTDTDAATEPDQKQNSKTKSRKKPTPITTSTNQDNDPTT